MTKAHSVDTEKPRQPIDRARLRALTDSLPESQEDAGRFIRGAREGERY
ncbi:hypothetical protein [Spiribacter onubensis]|uniref:DUF1778 domain-containing protein n=1 Tax=Spiribacter onubensis TaxID=3122420 RepID=A0ABV3SDJ1_9GAMM